MLFDVRSAIAADSQVRSALTMFVRAACIPGARPASNPTIADTKFSYGLALAQQGIKAINNQGKNADASAKAALDESEKAFRGIINARQDLVLMNRSFMQVGDVLECGIAHLGAQRHEIRR